MGTMGEDNSCCSVSRKTVVLVILTICCCMLVIWTITVTAMNADEPPEKMIVKANTSYPSILAVCPLNSSLSLQTVAIALTKEKSRKSKPQTKQLIMGSPSTKCKCLCDIKATHEEIEEALILAKEKKTKKM